jgi:hypothetical protein
MNTSQQQNKETQAKKQVEEENQGQNNRLKKQ